MELALDSVFDVFIFIIFCSCYVCSILWIFGDAATRAAGAKGMIFPLLFVIAGALALIKGYNLALVVWPAGYVAWFYIRPAEEVEQTE